MKHSGKALVAALTLIARGLFIVAGIYAVGIAARYVLDSCAAVAFLPLILWAVFSAFVLYFFRDPNPVVPREKGCVVSPAHGKIDVIEEINEPEFMGGSCRRVSMFLSPLDVHVQNAPVSGKVVLVKHTQGQFLAAMRKDCGLHNENVLIGFESKDVPGNKLGIRLVAGYLARRCIPWVKPNEDVSMGDRISVIQFGSRCDVYLPLQMKVVVNLGDKVKGGETVLARIE
ncbi:MAG: phosphatidylserine decarboxylase [Verrucomicrobiae bacterium]|nr:phosphatidylserine decarboxylase [Verrucomicrobiae bacterium]